MIPKLLRAGKPKVLGLMLGALAVATMLDWATGAHVSMAPLYIIPMMLGAVVLGRTGCAALAVVCALLRAWFDVPGPQADLALRFVFASIAYFLSALFVTALVRNHHLTVAHMQQLRAEEDRRREAEEQLRLLVESSPAAIFILDRKGRILSANNAASRLLGMREEAALSIGSRTTDSLGAACALAGRNIRDFIPFFANALAVGTENFGLRSAVKCQGERVNGEPFSADAWFSSYESAEGRRLAAIVVDSSEEMRDREEQGLVNLRTGNRIATAAIAHEVRNFCQAMAMLSLDLKRRRELADDEALRGLDRLVGGLERIASLELRSTKDERIGPTDLKDVLDSLRIIVEPEWREIQGSIIWETPQVIPQVLAEAHGLLQAFLNLAQNSLRAVQKVSKRVLHISVKTEGEKVLVRFRDSGLGIQTPEALFRPFQDSSAGTGIGLYVSRFIVRGFGGELRFDPEERETCFVVELDAA